MASGAARRKCFPGVSIAKYHGPNRQRLSLFDKSIVVTTYGVLASEARPTHSNHENRLDTVVWHRLIFDEAHVLRNMNSVQYRVCSRLCATHKWVVTGTPNTLQDGCLSLMQTRLVFDHLRARDMLLRSNVSCPMLALMAKTMIRHRKAMRILGRPLVSLPPCTRAILPVAMSHDEAVQHDNVYHQVELFYRRSRYTGLKDFEVQRLRRLLSSAPAGQDMGLEVAPPSLRDVAEGTIKDDCCGICLGDFDVPVVTKHCHHVFCDECMQNLFAASAHKCPMCRTPCDRTLLLVHPVEDDGPVLNFGSKIKALFELVRAAADEDKFLVVLQFQGSMAPIRSALQDMATVYSLASSMPQSKRKEPGSLRGGRRKSRFLALGTGWWGRRQPHRRQPGSPLRALSGQGTPRAGRRPCPPDGAAPARPGAHTGDDRDDRGEDRWRRRRSHVARLPILHGRRVESVPPFFFQMCAIMLLKKAGWLLSKNEDPSICEKSHFEKKFF